jgi:hypothetical protein
VVAAVRLACTHVPAQRIVVTPDRWFNYWPRDVAFRTTSALVRKELQE